MSRLDVRLRRGATVPEFPAAACRTRPDLPWVDDTDAEGAAEAKRLCNTCPHLEDCRLWGLVAYEYGIWGGLDWNDRKEHRAAARQAQNRAADRDRKRRAAAAQRETT
jgi:hypothetical protein